MNFRNCVTLFAFMLTASFCFPVFAQEGLSIATKDFAYKAFVGDQFEIESSQIAITQATSPEVKEFAQMMIVDHTKIADAFKQTLVARKLGLSRKLTLDKRHQVILDGLKTTSASTFDNLYIKGQTDAHERAISLFINYVQNGDNDDMKKFAIETLPILEQHLGKIQSLKKTSVSAE